MKKIKKLILIILLSFIASGCVYYSKGPSNDYSSMLRHFETLSAIEGLK